MSDWIDEFGRKRIFAILFIILMVIGVSVTVYVDYHRNYVVFDENTYSLDTFYNGRWHFISETGKNFTVQEATGKDYVHMLSDLTMTIDEDTYEINSEINYSLGRRTKSEQVRFIEFDGERVDAMGIYVVISSMDDSIFFLMIIIFLLVNSVTCVSLLYPEPLWKVNMLFVTRGGEPTDFYIASTGLMGIFLWCVTVFKCLNMV